MKNNFGLALAAMTFSAPQWQIIAKKCRYNTIHRDTPTAASPHPRQMTVKPERHRFPNNTRRLPPAKNALTQDNGKDTLSAAGIGHNAFKSGHESLPRRRDESSYGYWWTTKENAEHISENAGKIDSSKRTFHTVEPKTWQTLSKHWQRRTNVIQGFCPMADNGKGTYGSASSR